ncbi:MULTISPECIES: ABC transporter family substrate-binding protein [unclassified Kitasatospora]|uniref:ABC transporter family substrate-binding protein n=1 Tax=unclassified Kitasatospora TaxID=2633591 RepID=UPI000708E54D|nr:MULTISPECIES: ABC transporter family substrate-binding protein [unclassified Kitasatospora]KQV11772.1 ABC transporter substrate-binding protein [Kitasatospora sp. Root107]KRB76646.1 ABC transporter substrate-binding protein [Kitasatospora sp. Root187]
MDTFTTARGLRRAAVLAIALALAVTGCSSAGSGSGDGAKNVVPTQDAEDNNPQPLDRIKDGGEFRPPLQQWITQWNPYQVDGRYGDAVEIMYYTQAKLFRTDAKGVFNPVPEYLTSAEVTSKSPQVITYKINPKAKWSDGKQLGVQDFKAVWESTNGKNPAYNIADSSGYEQISSVEQGADAQEVKVTFDKPYADWQNLFNPLIPAAGIATPEAFNEGWIEKVPVWGGPFKVGTIDKTAQTITLVPNPEWWGPKPKLDKITYRVLASPAITQAFLNNEVDYASAGTATAYGQLKDAKDGVIRTGTPWDEVHISFGGNGPLADKSLRQALGLALDRAALIKIVNQGVPVEFKPLGNHLFMTNQSGYQDNSGDWVKFNVPGAKELLDKAGWKESAAGQPRTKDGQPLELHYVLSDGAAQAQIDLATAVQNMLQQVGVKLTVDKVPSKEYFGKYVNEGKFDLASWRNTGSFPLSAGVGNFRAPQGDNVFGNYSKLATPEIDELLRTAAATLDPAEAAKLYNKADAQIWELGHTYELYQRPSIVAVRKGLANFGAGSLADTDITKVGWEK